VESFEAWERDFEDEAERRRAEGDPDWDRGAWLDPAIVRSLQRFQVGEAGDGANLIAKAGGDRAGGAAYLGAVRLFVAEEQNHARLLALLLNAAHGTTIAAHWTDTVFVRLRRALGLRLELLVLFVAEVVALRYYRAVRDGSGDALASEVAGRILADEERHVRFHRQRLAGSFAELPPRLRPVVGRVWRLLFLGAALVVAHDHGPALRRLGLRRREFVRDVLRLFTRHTADVVTGELRPQPHLAVVTSR
jgi:hypothetical protein